MTDHASSPGDPDLAQGIPLADLPDGGMVTGHVGDAPVLLVRRAGTCFAVGATCTHYGAPLADGLVVDDTIRCPWHHACFSLRTGEALRAPALSGLTCWRVEQRDGKVFVRDALPAAAPPVSPAASHPASVVIVGGGAAGNAAAQTLRQQGYQGPVTLLSADPALPYDRPNLSKDYLAGTAQADWLPLHAPEFYAERQIDVRCGARAVKLDPRQKIVTLADGGQLAYDALLLATGADPIRLAAPGATLPHVAVLRTLADCDALIARAGSARRCVVVGASFIGLEVAAALRTRGVEIHVVAPEARPMERVLGAALGDMVKALHEAHGVTFHLGATVAAIDADRVTLSTGASLAAELVVTGIGVRPDIALAQDAGLAIDRGVTVDAFLQTSAPGIYAAGDIARWPDPRTGERIRVEHWVVAERQGAAAALNILGQRKPFAAVPFFWSQHYDVAINYVGHAEHWDRIDVDGDPAAHDCTVTYWRDGKPLAVATVGRDRASLDAEAAFERQTPA
ncbi:FAD-dependent oxidoreductase [Burkholderia stagnalis]|uniref:Pyridine nucleotide-disulfide oxidoreductase n=1 Tax=Burkholderia stagnalis TaxID=1503054 RepID=A0A108AF17_9BURK|nr:FAD-dependent oxidoreductase [Burkholderia stagnalis]KVZ15711.1 pyridine nucleotide-disulfide oxidoreductase [Burkholderia stagnalis]KWA50951.1 pyridine nucleotide-disulfide oxidoreductase [Burkholderia stagnalis]KWA54071.1 pyridine nucleotide-disulfide oxidoreductase [Burkholderia stagnalis]KWA54633.1 pyridine nucleotide-disulfide oxidoreductase [Burkholderia stagnalis]KWD03279.1 pyridine nucleotide-disulfide oxidoreductase [Burkholderia stagnalis]